MKVFFRPSKSAQKTQKPTPTSVKTRSLFAILIGSLLLTSSTLSHESLTGWICKDIETKHEKLLSDDVYDELMENIDWDMGQDTLRGELAAENQKIMRCLFDGGFNYQNIVQCVGDNYSKVIEAYHFEFDSTRHKFEESILNALRHNDYHHIAFEPFAELEKDLKAALEQNSNPEMALNAFEKAIVGLVPVNMSHLEDLKRKAHAHYLVYLSFKRLIKAYILLTISCIQSFVDLSQVAMPREFNYRLFSQDELDEMFPEDEITKMYTKKRTPTEEADEDAQSENSEISFNEGLAKQGKYRNAIALHVATGRVDPGTIDHSKPPAQIYKELIGNERLDRGRSEKSERLV